MDARNDQLADLLQEVRLTRGRLAHHVGTSTTTVSRWIDGGRRPLPATQQLVLDILSARTGRTLSPADAGWRGPGETTAAHLGDTLLWAETLEVATIRLDGLARQDLESDVDRREFLVRFSALALAAPSRNWLLSTLSTSPSTAAVVNVDGMATAFRAFAELETMHGGGVARAAAAAYLRSTVLPRLSDGHSEAQRRALCSAAAQHTYGLAWMTWDDGAPGPAQGYLTQALKLAAEASDPVLGAHILTGAAHLILDQGVPSEAVHLLQAAQAGVGMRPGAQAVTARSQVLLARALAACGDKPGAIAAVHAAELAQDRVQGELPPYVDYVDVAYLSGEAAAALTATGDVQAAQSTALLSLKASARGRRAAFTRATLARRHILAADLDQAAHELVAAHEAASSVRSTRARDAVSDVRNALQPYRHVPAVAHALTSVAV